MDTEQVYNEQLILATKVRRRNKLQLQLALLGQTADPSVSMQIEDLDKEIAELSKKLNIKPEGILIDTSVNLKDRRVLLLQVSYDVSNIIMDYFAECIHILLDYEKAKNSQRSSDDIDNIVRQYEDKENELWKECGALTTILKENRLYFHKKADLATSGFVKKIFRFVNFDWFGYDENLKDAIIEWDEYIDRAHKNIVDAARIFIESDNKS